MALDSTTDVFKLLRMIQVCVRNTVSKLCISILPFWQTKSQVRGPRFGQYIEEQEHLDVKRQKLKRTEQGLRIVVKYSYCVICTPFRYRSNAELEVVASPWYKFGNRVGILLTILSTALQFIGLSLDILNKRFNIHNRITPFRIINMFLFAMVSIMHINLERNAHQISEIWNLMIGLFNGMPTHSKIRKMDRMCFKLMMSLFVHIITIQLFYIILYLYYCEYHILGSVLPTCEAGIDGIHKATPVFIFYLAIEAIITIPLVGCTAFSANAVLVACKACKTVLEILRPEFPHETVKFTREVEKKWNTWYRCLNMFAVRHHNCFGQTVIPAFIFGVVFVIVLSNYIIISPATDFFVKCFAGTLNTVLVLYIVIVIQDATRFPKMSMDLLLSKRLYSTIRPNYMRCFLNSCQPMRIYIRDFFFLPRDFIPTMALVVLIQTINAILT